MTLFRIGALAAFIAVNSAGVAVNAAWAQEDQATTDNAQRESNGDADWRDNILRSCVEQYGAAQCADEQFLEDNFHLKSLEAAHNTATQRARDLQQALRELTLQHVCNSSASSSCGNDANADQCIARVEQMCAMLKTEADNCVSKARGFCASNADSRACLQRRSALCPSPKKQSIEQLLAKYPKLSATQKARVINTAAALDAKTSGWWSDLMALIKAPFQ